MGLPSLYLITDRKAAGPKGLVPTLEAAFKAGVTLAQLREKDLPATELLALAKEAVAAARRHGARLLVNDRTDIAVLAGADGVHLTSKSYSPVHARALLGKEGLIGVSTHSVEEALRAEEDGADFVTFGPVFHTPSKEGMGAPLGTDALTAAAHRLSIPVYGLGGVGPDNIEDVISTDANAALISAIMADDVPERAASVLLAAIERLKRTTRSPDDTD